MLHLTRNNQHSAVHCVDLSECRITAMDDLSKKRSAELNKKIICIYIHVYMT